jgi:dynein heavy chain
MKLFEICNILSQTREPRAVVPHLGKCFENIKDLEFDETEGGFPRITAMWSAEGEKVQLDQVLPAAIKAQDALMLHF